MKILGIDSSSLVASVAVTEDDVLIAEYTVNFKKTHSQTLLPMFDEMARLVELDLHTIDGIAVAGGPGSFTGLRIGTATAKGLGLALNKPLIHVPTLDAMAYNLWGSDRLLCPMMDAKRNQVYTGFYYCRTDLEVVKPQYAVDVGELIEELNKMGRQVLFLGDGVPVYRQQIEAGLKVPFQFVPAHNNRQRAGAVAALGGIYLKQGRTVSAAEFQPDYLRKSQAEREREEKQQVITIRRMEEGDLEQTAELERLCFSEPWSLNLLRDSFSGPWDTLFVAEQRGRIQGYACLRILTGEGEIQRIAVHPDVRRLGIGSKLMEAMDLFSCDQKVGVTSLEVRAGNKGAISLYKSYGFEEAGVRKGYYRSPKEDAVIMRRGRP